jgi:hypothetical protein
MKGSTTNPCFKSARLLILARLVDVKSELVYIRSHLRKAFRRLIIWLTRRALTLLTCQGVTAQVLVDRLLVC